MNATVTPLSSIKSEIPAVYVSACEDFFSKATSHAAGTFAVSRERDLALAYVLGLWLLSRNARDRILKTDALQTIREQASRAIADLRQLTLHNDAFAVRDMLYAAGELPASAEAHLV